MNQGVKLSLNPLILLVAGARNQRYLHLDYGIL
jgi:hypothetical protein